MFGVHFDKVSSKVGIIAIKTERTQESLVATDIIGANDFVYVKRQSKEKSLVAG